MQTEHSFVINLPHSFLYSHLPCFTGATSAVSKSLISK
nr:MAG TPA: hypothetical protein [Caudoviricetes sp.]